jgi:signal transduction histidine kinase
MSAVSQPVSTSTRKRLVRTTREEILAEWTRAVPACASLGDLLEQLAAVAVRFLDEQYDQSVSILTHDLRNPLGTIELTATMLLAQLRTDVPTRAHLELIHGSARRMDDLIGELLERA